MMVEVGLMKFSMNKYTILKFVNAKHAFLNRLSFAVIFSVLTLLIFRSIALAKSSYFDFITDDYKLAIRRFLALLSLYFNFTIVQDKTFNFCEELSLASLHVLEKKILSLLKKKPDDPTLLGEYIFLIASLIESGSSNQDHYISIYNKIGSQIIRNGSATQFKTTNEDLTVPAQGPSRNKLNLDEAQRAIADIANCFDRKGVKWFVVSGTFLGVIREGGFLPHDYDIDIGIMERDFDLDQVRGALALSNFCIKKIDKSFDYHFNGKRFVRSGQKKITLIKVVHDSGLNIDLFVHFEEVVSNNIVYWHGSRYHRWDNTCFELEKYNLCGVPILGPKDFDRYLTENYGDWRQPVYDFDFTTGTPNLVISNNPSSVALFLKRISELRGGDTYLRNKKVLVEAGYVSQNNEFDITKFKHKLRVN